MGTLRQDLTDTRIVFQNGIGFGGPFEGLRLCVALKLSGADQLQPLWVKTHPFVSRPHGSFRQLRTRRNVDAGRHWARPRREQLQQILAPEAAESASNR